VGRRAPEYELEYARRKWKMFPSIDRVYVNEKARRDLDWKPRYNFEYVLRRLRYNEEFRSALSITVGSKGYLLKESAEVDLDNAVRAVADGKPFFSPAIANALLQDYMRQLQQRGLQDSYDLLTEREKEVLQLLAEGKSNKDIANMLNLSTNTVETHRTRLMQKLNLHSSAEIVLYAVRKRIIS